MNPSSSLVNEKQHDKSECVISLSIYQDKFTGIPQHPLLAQNHFHLRKAGACGITRVWNFTPFSHLKNFDIHNTQP